MKPIRDSNAEISSSFVAVDVDELSQKLIANSMDHPSSTPRAVSVMMKKNLSRKPGSSNGSGAERERSNKTAEGDDERHATVGPGGCSGGSSPSAQSTVDSEDAVAAPTTPDGRQRRRVGTRRSILPWLSPSRVVIIFATLSSVGTLILLYFTLSTANTSTSE